MLIMPVDFRGLQSDITVSDIDGCFLKALYLWCIATFCSDFKGIRWQEMNLSADDKKKQQHSFEKI